MASRHGHSWRVARSFTGWPRRLRFRHYLYSEGGEGGSRACHLPAGGRGTATCPHRPAAPSCSNGSSASRKSRECRHERARDRKSTRLNSSHVKISYAVFCLKKKKKKR